MSRTHDSLYLDRLAGEEAGPGFERAFRASGRGGKVTTNLAVGLDLATALVVQADSG
jgi:hypothetical protein